MARAHHLVKVAGANREPNVDWREVEKFQALAARWWDPEGAFRVLHDINPLRLEFVEQRATLNDRDVADIGCGGGILAESMALRGARVVGVDAADAPLKVANMHQHESGTQIDYRCVTGEQLASEMPARFDVVSCMELLEHVPEPERLLAACADLLKPGGQLFVSTISRTATAFAVAILGAEHVLRLLPRGTHHYERFLRPSEVEAMARPSGLRLRELRGLSYSPFTRRARLRRNVDVNYLAWFEREDP